MRLAESGIECLRDGDDSFVCLTDEDTREMLLVERNDMMPLILYLMATLGIKTLCTDASCATCKGGEPCH